MKNRVYKRAFCWLLTLSLLLCLMPIASMAEEETTVYDEEETVIIPTPEVPSDGVQSGQITETEIITPELDTSVTANITQFPTPTIQSGVYSLVNILGSGKCVDTRGGGTTAGTAIQQWTLSTSIVRNQLFKVTYLGSDMSDSEPHHYYSIRPMTNSEMGLSAPLTGENRSVTLQPMSYTDTYDSIPPEQRWEIISDDYYWIKNGSTTNGGYLCGIASTQNGDQLVTVPDTGTNYESWDFVRYTGEEINGVKYQITTDSMRIGDSFTFKACVYSSVIGRNGPAVYSVRNYVTGTTTDKATINANTGYLTTQSTGTVTIWATYPTGENKVWWIHDVAIWIDEGTYFFKNRATDKYMQQDNNGGAFMEQHNFDGSDIQKWRIIADTDTNAEEGYYILRNVDTFDCMISPDSDSYNVNIDMEMLSNVNWENALWRFVLTADGSYKIQAKVRDGSDYYVALGAGLASAEGINIEQRQEGSIDLYRDEWFLEELDQYNVTFCGIANAGHDHSSALETSKQALFSKGYNNVNLITGAVSATSSLNYLKSTAVFTSRSHGCVVVYSGTTQVASTGIVLNDLEGASSARLYSHSWSGMNTNSINITSTDSFSDLQLVLFVGCETAYGGSGDRNLPTIVRNNGAFVSVGFKESIDCIEANQWTEDFYEYMLLGYTVQDAVNYASDNCSSSSGLQSAEICGYTAYRFGN